MINSLDEIKVGDLIKFRKELFVILSLEKNERNLSIKILIEGQIIDSFFLQSDCKEILIIS